MTDEQIMALWREMRPAQGDPDPLAFARRVEAIARHETAARIEALEEYSGKEGRRSWQSAGSWLYPGDMLAVLRA